MAVVNIGHQVVLMTQSDTSSKKLKEMFSTFKVQGPVPGTR